MQTQIQQISTNYRGTYHIPVVEGVFSTPLDNRTIHVWTAHIHTKSQITLEAWHNVAITICPSRISSQVYSASVVGEIIFRNPYGYLPAEMFGLLPFQVSLKEDTCMGGRVRYPLNIGCQSHSDADSIRHIRRILFLL